MSGLEYIKVTTDSPVKLTFVPDQPAYAPAYISVNALLRDLPTLLEFYSVVYRLKLITDVNAQPLPDERETLVIMEKKTNGSYHVRIFDAAEKKVIDRELDQFLPDDQLAQKPTNELIREIALSVGYPLSNLRRKLPPDTTDLDMKIEERDGLGISDTERQQILEIVRKDYFPPGYQFTQTQLDAYDHLEIVEELIEWLRITLQAATYDGLSAGSALAAYPTTSWVYVRSSEGAVYYAQPDQAPLYTAEASSHQFLDYLEVPSVGASR